MNDNDNPRSHAFEWQGKTRILLRRKDNAKWYIRLRDGGTDKWVNLGTPNRQQAEMRAKDVLRGVQNNRKTEVMEALRQRKSINTVRIGDLIEAFDAAPLGINETTRYNYRWALQRI